MNQDADTKYMSWDYTDLAASYSRRPNYADRAIDLLIERSGVAAGDPVLDQGAGTAHLTVKLAARGLDVTAAEPNERMREIGVVRTQDLRNVRWVDAMMQSTGLPDGAFALVTYGSSFGVADYEPTLREAHRLLRPRGALACLFNHRDVNDPLQQEIEALIRREIPGYEPGHRRQDQVPFIESTGHFRVVHRIEEPFVHEEATETWVEAWSSVATIASQAGERFPAVVERIRQLATNRYPTTVQVPYVTQVWIAEPIR